VDWNSNSRPESIIVGRQQRFYELPAAIAGTLLWLGIFISEGPVKGLEYVWILALGLALGAWAVLMRLCIQGSTLLFTVIGPWRWTVNLSSIENIRWSNTGRDRARGNIYVTDRHGGRVRIPVGRLDGIEIWGRALLDAAARSHASVDPTARELLEGAGAPMFRGRRT
jgi:hypothetical protein